MKNTRQRDQAHQALRDALRKLGNNPDYDGDVFYGGELIDRNCEKYEAKDER
jgi:hypothetical protein